MKRPFFAAVSSVTLVVAACGGQVVFVEDDDGSGGTTSTSTGKSTSLVGPTGKSSTAQSTAGPTSGVTSVVTTGPGGGAQLCVINSGSPACANCIENGNTQASCEASLNNCISEPDCIGFSDCISLCKSDLACCGECHARYPASAIGALYQAASCLYCEECSPQCDGALPGFCGN